MKKLPYIAALASVLVLATACPEKPVPGPDPDTDPDPITDTIPEQPVDTIPGRDTIPETPVDTVVTPVEEIPEIVDLSENGTANCYIVPAAGEYSFDATVVGDGDDGYIDRAYFYPDDVYIDPADVKVLWADEGVIDSLKYENGKVTFTAGSAKGNAQLAAYGSRNNVIWSWHLWFTDQPAEYTHTNGDGESFTLLDRNLGATSADPADGMATYGLYYQFGRKDPLRGVKGFRNNSVSPLNQITDEDASYYLIQESLSTPDRYISYAGRTSDWASNRAFNANLYLWGNPYYDRFVSRDRLVKTIYDPCPPGYIIAPGNTWEGVDESDFERLDNGVWFNTDSGKNFYAAAGSVGGGDAAGKISDGWYYFAEDEADYTQEEGTLYVCMWTSQAYYYSGDYTYPYGGKEFRIKIPFDYDSRTTYGSLIFQPNNGEGRRLRGFSVRCMVQTEETND